MPKARKWKMYAVIGAKSGYLLRDLREHPGIWFSYAKAKADCPSYGKVIPVEVRELKPRSKR